MSAVGSSLFCSPFSGLSAIACSGICAAFFSVPVVGVAESLGVESTGLVGVTSGSFRTGISLGVGVELGGESLGVVAYLELVMGSSFSAVGSFKAGISLGVGTGELGGKSLGVGGFKFLGLVMGFIGVGSFGSTESPSMGAASLFTIGGTSVIAAKDSFTVASPGLASIAGISKQGS